MTLLKAVYAAFGPKPFVHAAVFIGAVAALFYTVPNANADPFVHDAALVCRWLDLDDSPASVQAMFIDMVDEGLTREQATRTAVYALTVICPEHEWAIQRADRVLNGGGR